MVSQWFYEIAGKQGRTRFSFSLYQCWPCPVSATVTKDRSSEKPYHHDDAVPIGVITKGERRGIHYVQSKTPIRSCSGHASDS